MRAREVGDMRALMARERAAEGFWDMKLHDGGLVDIEFCTQYLQLIHAAKGGPLRQNTAEALEALDQANLAPGPVLKILRHAWELQQNLSQLLKVAIEDEKDPTGEPASLRALLIKAGDARRLSDLKSRLVKARAAAHDVFRALVLTPATEADRLAVEQGAGGLPRANLSPRRKWSAAGERGED